GRLRHLFADADDDIRIGRARGLAQRVRFRTGNLDRVLEQLDRELVGDRPGRGVVVIPNRVRGDETFGKSDDAGAIPAGLTDQTAGLFGRTFAVEKYGSSLHRRDFYLRKGVAHDSSTKA